MKIKKLNIKSYKHLENINLDFTYPEGHDKAGQPLEKICLIGQSATGKTSVLELLKFNTSKLNGIKKADGTHSLGPNKLDFDGNIEYLYDDELLILTIRSVSNDKEELPELEGAGDSLSKLIEKGLKLIYFSSEVISKKAIGIFNQNPLDILNALSEGRPNFPVQLNNNWNANYIHEFTQEIDEEPWLSLLGKIMDYRKKFTQMAAELINKGAIADLTKLNKQFSEWAADNKNPLVPFAELFNPILSKLNLEVDLINTEYAIPIKSKFNDYIVPISGLSTGTQGLLLSFFPLFELDTTDAIILVDEPERSLFPDIQIDLISNYQRLAPASQLIIATHSPFIAAAFEPEERFILYFDKTGKVCIRRGESPIGDDPNDILSNDFKVDIYNEFGQQAYQKYLDLKRKMAQETDPQKKKELLVELSQLGDKYNF